MTDQVLVPRELFQKAAERLSDLGQISLSEPMFALILPPAVPTCPKCGGSYVADSGGVHPWGEPILIACDCTHSEPTAVDLLTELFDHAQAYISAIECDHDFDGQEWAKRAKALIGYIEKD